MCKVKESIVEDPYIQLNNDLVRLSIKIIKELIKLLERNIISQSVFVCETRTKISYLKAMYKSTDRIQLKQDIGNIINACNAVSKHRFDSIQCRNEEVSNVFL